MNIEQKVLDHGFIRVVDVMGGDSSVVQSARISTGAGITTAPKDRGLIRYLMKHKHTSPFEMCEIKFHIKMPLFVARQWVRHRTANINEYSARYSVLPSEFYIPAKETLGSQSAHNHQCTDVDGLSDELKNACIGRLQCDSACSLQTYHELLDAGLSRELARLIIPLNTYTEIYWKIDLHNLLNFIRLRIADDAQYEIREYARILLDIVKIWVPFTYEAFMDYVLHARTFSAEEMRVLRTLVKNADALTEEQKKEYKLTKNEWKALEENLEIC